MERKWWKEAVVYQVYPRSFKDSNGDGIGDINGITQKLWYLKELGIDVIWLSPVYDSPNDDNGYDIRDYYQIMREFGTMEDFTNLLEMAHQNGIRIVMDLVVNHTSDENRWFVESRSGKENPYRDYYIWQDPVDGHEPSNWGSCFGGSAWEYDSDTRQYYLHLFSKKQPDLNWENAQVREKIYEMMRWWLDKGVDGFRMDVISLISKKKNFPDGVPGVNGYASFNEAANGPHVHEYLQEMRKEVLSHYDTLTVGECSGVTLEEAAKYASENESELNMVFQFELMDLDADPVTGSKWTDKKMELAEIRQVMSKWQNGLEGIAWNSLFWDNHDQPRIVSRLGEEGAYREVSAKMLATCLHMMQGTPYIYQGEELGMTNMEFHSLADFRDLDSINAYQELVEEKRIMTAEQMLRVLSRKSRDNARTPMQWDDTEQAGFTNGTPWIAVNPNFHQINAAEEVKNENSVFAYYKELIQLRKKYPDIVYGHYELLDDQNQDIYAYTRSLCEQKLLVVCNFTNKEISYEVPEEFRTEPVLITNYPAQKTGCLRPYEAIVRMMSKGRIG
ncbi:MAG: alpha,alpha-phosphotrehalase [Butyrivibrio sp.]|nr:alpha,alpha-phosphotrehalase [Butyrivibrio sp.]